MKSFLPYFGLLALAISAQNSLAQTQFQKTTNASSNDRNYHLTSLPSGALYATGYTDAVSGNKDDAFVIRFNAFGEVEWAKTYGDQQDDYSWDLIALKNGDLLGAGYSSSFGTPKNAATLTRIDSTGKVVWLAGLFNLSYGIDFYRAYETSTGHLLAGGLMQSASNSDEIVLCKFTQKGQFLWAKTIGTGGSDELMGITETSEGHYLLSGLMNSTNGFGSSDFGVVKLDTSGSMIWNKIYGGSSGDRLNDAIQIGNAYYFLGWSSSDGQGSNDVVLMKTDTAGKVNWTKFYGSSNGDLAFNMKFDKRDSSIVMAGYTDALGSSSRNSLLVKVDLDGDLIWANSYGKNSRDGHWPTGLVINHEDGYYLLGSSNSFSSNADYDLYLVKTDGDGKSGCNQADPSFKEKNVSWSGKSVASGSKPSLTTGTGTITPGNWNIKSRSACCNLSKPKLTGAHLCLEDTVRVGTSSIPKGYSFNWLYNNQSISTGSNIQIAYGNPGFYDLTVSAKGSNCKTQIESIEISNSKKPQTGLDSLYVFCEGEKVELIPDNNLKKTVWLSFQSQQPDTSFSRIYSETDTFL
ncbi:MAG: hypothetical protein KDC92_16880, partial [Bacteroidetes bacterium]|nr:hypothetical protein [Bacteroidota bacterium]